MGKRWTIVSSDAIRAIGGDDGKTVLAIWHDRNACGEQYNGALRKKSVSREL